VAQASRVQNLFHSVQLNVNNPHFLIMQGRITKVLNMKPKEVLGMLEEAAGTRMYEDKKTSALRVMEKKETKVQEINDVLAKEINPTLAKLKKEQRDYRKYQSNREEIEKLLRFVVAWDYAQAMAERESATSSLEHLVAEAATARADAVRLRALADSHESRVAELEAARASAMGKEYQDVAALESERSKHVTEASAKLTSAESTLEMERQAMDKAIKAAKAAEAAVEAAETKLRNQAAKDEQVRQRAETTRANLEAAQAAYEAACTGVAAAGRKAGEGGGTLQGRLMQAREAAATALANAESAEMRATHLRGQASQAAKVSKSAKSEFTKLQSAVEASKAKFDEAVAVLRALEKVDYTAAKEADMRERRDALAARAGKLEARVEHELGKMSSRLRFDYDQSAMGKKWSPEWVRGVVARLITVKDASAATALEIAAGGRLWQVVVETAEAGKALLKNGRLQQRVTLIPLDKVSSSTVDGARAARASSLTGGRAVPALSLVGFPEDVQKAVEYVFGRALVCEDSESARTCAFDKGVRCISVTKEGDVFDPAGTLEGGSRPSSAGVLLRLGKLADLQSALDECKAELAAVNAELSRLEEAGSKMEDAKAEVEIATDRLKLAQERMERCEFAEATRKAEEKESEAAAQEALATAQREEAARATSLVKELEADSGNDEARQKREEAAAAKALDTARAAADKAEAALAGATDRAMELTMEVDRARAESSEAQQTLKACEEAVREAEDKVRAVKSKVAHAKEVHAEAAEALEVHRERLAETDDALASVLRERDEARRGAERAETVAAKEDSEAKRLKDEADKGRRRAAGLEKKHPWIAEEREQFGRPATLYDFAATPIATARARLDELEDEQAGLKSRINLDAGAMLERAEREYRNLVDKKERIEQDKTKIQRVIAELDEKKRETLVATWTRVNKDFASIFSTLLPGTTAKLVPEAAAAPSIDSDDEEEVGASSSSYEAITDISSGLEIRVAFNGVWKESLTELSGGQRSLLALSLILAMLLFKPAPVYILDEVDAALDLSHTQNIGRMLRSHFGGSQFVVVSLKQGMFSNANVIFRTKFVDGVSTVTRTLGHHSAEAEPAAAATAAATASKRRPVAAITGAAEPTDL
jgi:structural maintenance of chromosome 2